MGLQLIEILFVGFDFFFLAFSKVEAVAPLQVARMNTEGGNMDSYVKKRKRSQDGDQASQGLSRSEPSISTSGSYKVAAQPTNGPPRSASPVVGEEAARKRRREGEESEQDESSQPPKEIGSGEINIVLDLSNPDQVKKLREFQVKSLAIETKEIKLGRQLGGGQNGVVYEGECRSKKVAVKVCKNLAGKKWDDFLEEIQIMA